VLLNSKTCLLYRIGSSSSANDADTANILYRGKNCLSHYIYI